MEVDYSNARTRVCNEYKSISGLDMGEWASWFELYCHGFMDKLDLLGFTDEADFVALLVKMDKYPDIGYFMFEDIKSKNYLAEVSAYGLVVFDRIVRSDIAKLSHQDLFGMHMELVECYDCVTENDASTRFALMGANKRHELGRADKRRVFSWCDENMDRFKSMDDAAADIAETFVPQKFRAVRGWMTEWRKLRSTGTP